MSVFTQISGTRMRGKNVIMDNFETKLISPDNFPFPFSPYSIQRDFMKNLYECLEGRKLGIFESPTGTGKSMSLICGSLKWLLDAQQRLKKDVELNIQKFDKEVTCTSSGNNWLEEHASLAKIKQKRDELRIFLNKIERMESRIQEIEIKGEKINEINLRTHKLNIIKRDLIQCKENKRNLSNVSEDDNFDDNEILLNHYTSLFDNCMNSEVSSDSDVEAENEEKYNGIKVFICSRTHSQLSQLVKEVQKSPYNDLKVRVISLASRQNYCLNESVLKLNNLSLINEKCQDMHSKKKEKPTKYTSSGETLKKQKMSKVTNCPFYSQFNINNVKIKALNKIQDIEEMVHWGKEFCGCPYYASRYAVDDAQVVFVPYNTLLHKNTREACGINLKDSVVIIDEAHNLLDTIGNIHSCSVNGQELIMSYSQLVQYKEKYSERFTPLNLLHLNQLIFTINKFLEKIGGKGGIHHTTATQKNEGSTLETLPEFLLSSEVDTINFYKVVEFINKSQIVNKLRGFVDKYNPSVVLQKKREEKGVSAFLKKLSSVKEESNPKEIPSSTDDEFIAGNPLLSVATFIQSLTNSSLDGRIVITQGKTIGTSYLKFLLLNPASHFGDIVKEARSVILAGGTMQPISEFTDQLFLLAGGDPSRVSVFTCGHIIPEENILPITISSGPSGKVFDFSYNQRSNTEILDELGRLLINVTNVVPAGVVCFFPSYDYENNVFEHLKRTRVIDKIQNKKKVLREPKKSTDVDAVLKDYSDCVSKQGALLFSVVGGKLSEGLNFNDDLGRCVIVVGLPFPNLTSPELKEKMAYLDKSVGNSAGKVYYENLCMKAVNQSIGRSVRHKNDYASVLLIDQRYSKTKYIKALPEWIQKSVKVEQKFGPVIGLLARFFSSKKNI